MDQSNLMEICRESVLVLIKISMPVLLIAMVVGLIISLFQALTQIQENTLSFVPKIIAVFFSLVFLAPYIVSTLKAFNENIMSMIVHVQ